MDWSYPSGAGPEGIFEIGRRLSAQIGRVPDATSFTNDAREMLRVTRRVESVARGGRLFAGFQTADKLEVERARYENLVADGTDIVVFAEGHLAEPIEGLEYRALRPDRWQLANNWFLVADAPEPVAFVSWEISDDDAFGRGGAATPGKAFVGFISDDPEVVAELIGVLESWARPASPEPRPSTDEPERLDAASQGLIGKIERTSVEATGADPGAVIVAFRRADDDQAFITAAAIARSEQRPLVIVDRSSESIFGSPYNDLRGDDEFRPRPDRLFGAGTAVREGRARTARAITAASALGIEAGGWFPTRSGSDGLSEAVERFDGTVIVLPASVRKPPIAERIRGMTLEALAALGTPIVVADQEPA